MSLLSHPIKKLTLAAAFGIGYTLGAKAGRERYEQIKRTAQNVKDDPRVQDVAAKAESVVRDTAQQVKEDPRVKDVVDRAESLVGDAADKAKDVTEDVKDAANDGDLVDQAKHVAQDVKDKAQDVAADAKDKAQDVAADAKDKADDVATKAGSSSSDSIGEKVENVAKHAADKADEKAAEKTGGNGSVSPLLADEHVEVQEEVVYTSGPDSTNGSGGRS